jgi:hypothetical protein
MNATDRQRDRLTSLGVRTIPKDLTLGAASVWIDELYEEDFDGERDERTGLSVWFKQGRRHGSNDVPLQQSVPVQGFKRPRIRNSSDL